jgi:hypothetical protein
VPYGTYFALEPIRHDPGRTARIGAGTCCHKPNATQCGFGGHAGRQCRRAAVKRELAVAIALTGAWSINEVHRGLIELDRC